jgi:2-C-methyl-D-erythritol 4-phosphate cytidylyltransferase
MIAEVIMERTHISVIIPAAGQGKRMNAGINKQFLAIDGKPILAITIDAFQKCRYVDEIIVVINPDEKELIQETILEVYDFRLPVRLITGGKERQDSVYNGLQAVNNQTDIVMIHDGARPFVSQDIIEKSIKETKKHKATITAVPVKDTIKTVSDDLKVTGTLKRNELFQVQTPQSFDCSLLKAAYRYAKDNNITGNDDSTLVESYGHYVTVVHGEYSNIKITTPEDLVIGEAIRKIIKDK